MEISEEELKAKIDEAIESATGGLAKKNQELLAELKEARKGKAIDPAEIDRLQSKIDALEADLGTAAKAKKDQEKALKLEIGRAHV